MFKKKFKSFILRVFEESHQMFFKLVFLFVLSLTAAADLENSECDEQMLKRTFVENIRILEGLKGCLRSPDAEYGYYFTKDKMTKNNAKEKCNSMNGQVAHTEFETEEKFKNVQLAISDIDSKTFWLGANRQEGGEFTWENGKSLNKNMSMWCKGEPNNSNKKEGCVQLKRSCFNDISCDKKFSVLCQIKCK